MALEAMGCLPSKHLRDLLSESRALLQACFSDKAESVRQAAVVGLTAVLLRADVLSYAVPYQSMLENVLKLWGSLCSSMVDASNLVGPLFQVPSGGYACCNYLQRSFCGQVSYAAFSSVAAMINGFCRTDGGGLAWLPVDVPNAETESKSVQLRVLHCVCRQIFRSRHTILNRVNSLPREHRSPAIRSLTLAIRLMYNGTIHRLHQISGMDEEIGFEHADVLSFMAEVNAIIVPFLSSTDPSLVFEVAAWVLETAMLSDVHRSGAASAGMSVLGLLDRNNYVVGRPVILACVARNVHLVCVLLTYIAMPP